MKKREIYPVKVTLTGNLTFDKSDPHTPSQIDLLIKRELENLHKRLNFCVNPKIKNVMVEFTGPVIPEIPTDKVNYVPKVRNIVKESTDYDEEEEWERIRTAAKWCLKQTPLWHSQKLAKNYHPPYTPANIHDPKFVLELTVDAAGSWWGERDRLPDLEMLNKIAKLDQLVFLPKTTGKKRNKRHLVPGDRYLGAILPVWINKEKPSSGDNVLCIGLYRYKTINQGVLFKKAQYHNAAGRVLVINKTETGYTTTIKSTIISYAKA
jgi:hypothetical protein